MATETFVVSSSGKATIKKDPDDVLDYTWDWTEWLDAIVDTISSKSIVVSGTVVEDSSLIVSGSKKVTAVLSGGTLNETHRVTCRIVTAGGRTADRSIYLKMRER